MNQSFFSSLVLNIKHLLPSKCRCLCCKETTKDRLFAIGYKKMKKEIEIQSILRSLRVVKAATKRNFTEQEWTLFKREHGMRYLHLTQLTETSKFKAERRATLFSQNSLQKLFTANL